MDKNTQEGSGRIHPNPMMVVPMELGGRDGAEACFPFSRELGLRDPTCVMKIEGK